MDIANYLNKIHWKIYFKIHSYITPDGFDYQKKLNITESYVSESEGPDVLKDFVAPLYIREGDASKEGTGDIELGNVETGIQKWVKNSEKEYTVNSELDFYIADAENKAVNNICYKYEEDENRYVSYVIKDFVRDGTHQLTIYYNPDVFTKFLNWVSKKIRPEHLPKNFLDKPDWTVQYIDGEVIGHFTFSFNDLRDYIGVE